MNVSKKIIFSIALIVASLSQAQIIISNQPNPTPANSSVLLEFGNNENKGIVLPQVASVSGTIAGGTFIANSTVGAVQYYDGTQWINLTDADADIEPDSYVEHSFSNIGIDTSEGLILGATTTIKPGTLVLESSTQALVLPKVADPHTAIQSPIAGTIVYDTISDSLAVFDGKLWSYWK